MQSGQYGGQGGMSEQGMKPGMTGMSLSQDGCVLTCTASDCSFNRGLECYAKQIAVGDDHPKCDTYTQDMMAQPSKTEGIVMSCGVTQCNFNDQQHCGARGITVEMHQQHADCATFRP